MYIVICVEKWAASAGNTPAPWEPQVREVSRMNANASPPHRQRKPVARSIHPLGNGVYRIEMGDDWDNYSITPIPCELGGVAFAVYALTIERDAPVYHVRVSRPGVATCDCAGGT